jgi:hypothetical protein
MFAGALNFNEIAYFPYRIAFCIYLFLRHNGLRMYNQTEEI